jgi:hypothetical protein
MVNETEKQMIDIPKNSLRYKAALRVSGNWRIQKRLPRITALALALGLINHIGE